mmetsp:Transcript_22379/g.53755  ORF Transcript_22379/g.53755 Transcript_22379/m.53755 type:complete len:86 (+) Transcript_22379:212-469(+)
MAHPSGRFFLTGVSSTGSTLSFCSPSPRIPEAAKQVEQIQIRKFGRQPTGRERLKGCCSPEDALAPRRMLCTCRQRASCSAPSLS